MTAYNYLYFIAIGLIVIGWGAHIYAAGDVTVGAASPSSSTMVVPSPGLAPDGTPIVHKSLHKKKTQAGSATTTVATSPPLSAAAAPVPAKTMVVPAVPPKPVVTLTPFTPTVETGLPVARHSGGENVTMYQAPISPGGSLPIVSYGGSSRPLTGQSKPSTTYQSSMVGGIPTLSPGLTTTSTSYLPKVERKPTHVYPWKTDIITTMFWIGEGGSALSATTNLGSAWIEDWRSANRGSDNPDERKGNGYLPSGHMATVNPFYVALPFNDLAWPEKAREWVPRYWRRPNKDGKQVSWCQHRWVEIKNERGDRCFAQWEDVGPLRTDHAEYVFGDERPNTMTRAGLDVSPAVAKRLDINGDRRSLTRWHFVDDEDVPPGPWLALEEQAVIAKAITELKNSDPASVPMPRTTAPMDDPSNVGSNKKKISAAKG